MVLLLKNLAGVKIFGGVLVLSRTPWQILLYKSWDLSQGAGLCLPLLLGVSMPVISLERFGVLTRGLLGYLGEPLCCTFL